MQNFDSLLKILNILKSSIQSIQTQAFWLVKYNGMLIIRSRLCPKCTFKLLYTSLNLEACKINYASGTSAVSKKGGGL